MCCVNLFCLVFICLLKANHRGKNAVINIIVLFVDTKKKMMMRMILKDHPMSAIC